MDPKECERPGETRPLVTPGPEDLARLSVLLPPGRVLLSPEARERYSRDESTRLYSLPDAVVLPRSEEEVSAVLAWAFEGFFPVIARGAGTGVAGGAVAVGGGVVLSLEKMDEIIEIDRENMTARVMPGVVTARLQREAEALGLFYPPDPASAENCTIGGNVSVGAGGARAVKYGTTRHYVLGMRAASSRGEILVFGGKNIKDATGYHLMDLMVGSEGTLGIITEVTLRLVPLPGRVSTLLVPFADLEDAVGAVTEIMASGLWPTAAEFMDDVAVEAAERYLGRPLPGGEKARAYVLFSFDGETLEELEQRMVKAGGLVRGRGALDVFAALDPGQQSRLWESRRTLGDAMKAMSPVVGKADVVVPRGSVPRLVREVKAAAGDLGLRIACFGHAGDGNVHVNILKEKTPDGEWEELLCRAMDRVMDAVAALGGKPSGEHGLGILKKGELERFAGTGPVNIMRELKAVFDPRGILNPGKVL